MLQQKEYFLNSCFIFLNFQSKIKHHVQIHLQNHTKTHIKSPKFHAKSAKIHHKKPKFRPLATLKPPSSYLIPNPKFKNQATEKSSDSDNHTQTATTIVNLEPHASTLNPVYEYSEEINSHAEKEFSERRQRLWEVCELNKLIGKLTPNAWEFFISPGHGLTWCNVFKAASSTWMYYFNILGESSLGLLLKTLL